MGKFSSYPPDTAPTTDDYVLSVDAGTGSNRKVLLSDLLILFSTQTLIPSGGGSPVTRQNENLFNYVASGMVWSGDAYASTRNASMTSGVVYINGRRIAISAVTARSFTASKDTYVDVLDNADGTGTLVYTEVVNNAASPALAANSIRVGIVITGAANIAAATSINQGQEDRLLPIASSIVYTVSDSLGNLICSRDPTRKLLGYAQSLTSQSGISTLTDLTGLQTTVNVPTGRKIKISGSVPNSNSTVNGDKCQLRIYEGATQMNTGSLVENNLGQLLSVVQTITPTAGVHTYKLAVVRSNGTGTFATNADANNIPSLMVEIE